MVRANAGKHWGRAETIRELMPALGESAADFNQMRDGLYQALAPRDAFEEMVVDDMAEIHWRLRRMIRGEVAEQARGRREQMRRQDEWTPALSPASSMTWSAPPSPPWASWVWRIHP
jgi:hypothetical protein